MDINIIDIDKMDLLELLNTRKKINNEKEETGIKLQKNMEECLNELTEDREKTFFESLEEFDTLSNNSIAVDNRINKLIEGLFNEIDFDKINTEIENNKIENLKKILQDLDETFYNKFYYEEKIAFEEDERIVDGAANDEDKIENQMKNLQVYNRVEANLLSIHKLNKRLKEKDANIDKIKEDIKDLKEKVNGDLEILAKDNCGDLVSELKGHQLNLDKEMSEEEYIKANRNDTKNYEEFVKAIVTNNTKKQENIKKFTDIISESILDNEKITNYKKEFLQNNNKENNTDEITITAEGIKKSINDDITDEVIDYGTINLFKSQINKFPEEREELNKLLDKKLFEIVDKKIKNINSRKGNVNKDIIKCNYLLSVTGLNDNKELVSNLERIRFLEKIKILENNQDKFDDLIKEINNSEKISADTKKELIDGIKPFLKEKYDIIEEEKISTKDAKEYEETIDNLATPKELKDELNMMVKDRTKKKILGKYKSNMTFKKALNNLTNNMTLGKAVAGFVGAGIGFGVTFGLGNPIGKVIVTGVSLASRLVVGKMAKKKAEMSEEEITAIKESKGLKNRVKKCFYCDNGSEYAKSFLTGLTVGATVGSITSTISHALNTPSAPTSDDVKLRTGVQEHATKTSKATKVVEKAQKYSANDIIGNKFDATDIDGFRDSFGNGRTSLMDSLSNGAEAIKERHGMVLLRGTDGEYLGWVNKSDLVGKVVGRGR